jgi:hypothetical protein
MKNQTLFVLALLLSLFLLSPQDATGQITLVGEKIQRVQALPGEQYTGQVMIHNESDSALTVRIYQDEITALTSFDRGDKIITINKSNADWITHSSDRMVIRSGEIATVNYQVSIPVRFDSQEQGGSYWSTLAVDVVALGQSEFIKPYSRHRLAEITTDIKGRGDTGLAINTLRIDGKAERTQNLEAVMVNTGDVLVKPDVWFEIYNVAGRLEDRVPGTADWVFPGGFHRVKADVSHLRPGVYETQVVVDAGANNIFGASYTVDTTGIGRVAQSTTSGQTRY